MAEPGYLGKVTINVANTVIGGMLAWNYSGDVRASEEVVEFGSAIVHDEPTLIRGGEVQISGNVKIGDAGVTALNAAFDAGTKLGPTAVKFYINATKYLCPTTGSTVFVTKVKSMSNDAAGIAKIEATFKVDGQLEEK